MTEQDELPRWAYDMIGQTDVIDGKPHYGISDMTEDDAWIVSDTSVRLDKIR